MASRFQETVRRLVDTQREHLDWENDSTGVVMYFPIGGSDFEVYNVTVVDLRECLDKGVTDVVPDGGEDWVISPDETFESTLKPELYAEGEVLWVHPVKSGVMACDFTQQEFYSECNDGYGTPFYLINTGKEFILA